MTDVALPKIEDNARGVEPQVLCTIRVWGNNNRQYHMKAVPRGLLEAGFSTIGRKLLELSDTANGLRRITVEVCADGEYAY